MIKGVLTSHRKMTCCSTISSLLAKNEATAWNAERFCHFGNHPLPKHAQATAILFFKQRLDQFAAEYASMLANDGSYQNNWQESNQTIQ